MLMPHATGTLPSEKPVTVQQIIYLLLLASIGDSAFDTTSPVPVSITWGLVSDKQCPHPQQHAPPWWTAPAGNMGHMVGDAPAVITSVRACTPHNTRMCTCAGEPRWKRREHAGGCCTAQRCKRWPPCARVDGWQRGQWRAGLLLQRTGVLACSAPLCALV